MHEGHRQRMLQRLEENEDSLQDHELMEILLFNAIPRKNTNEIAHALLTAFGSPGGVLRASVSDLKTVAGIGSETAAYLRCIGILCKYTNFNKESFPKGLSLSAMEPFLVERYAGLKTETLEIYCVDRNKQIVQCQRFTDFLETEASADMDKINKLFSSQSIHGILIAHNHPTESAVPSEKDDRFTMQLLLYCSLNRVHLFDHLIVGRDGVYSYFKQRRLDDFRERCNVQSIIDEKLKFRSE